jgi:dTDP-4-dehydrorhamnose 3,5-epimerase
MIFAPVSPQGLVVVEPELDEDTRGFFARLYSDEDFAAAGISRRFCEWSVSFNRRRGTLRGLHFQAEPHPEAKLVRCTSGAIYDVAVDLRPGSTTFGSWWAAELSAANHRMLFVPEGFAHGFQSLEDETEVAYAISEPYVPELARGVRWDDPDLAIPWPLDSPTLSARDRELPSLAELSG